MFLLLTNKRDLTSDYVVLELQRRGLPYCRLNTEDLPSSELLCDPIMGRWRLAFSHRTIELSDVRAGYFRRPGMPAVETNFPAAEKGYCAAEWAAVLQALNTLLGHRWLNAPSRISQCEDKIHQLTSAHRLGFRVPPTLVTNDPAAAREFATSASIIGKPLRTALLRDETTERVIFTHRVQIDASTDPAAIRACPMILQREIRKRFDLRVTVVGDQAFSVSIDSQAHEETQVDWRRTSNPGLAHAIFDLPVEERERCIALTRDLGLRFGAIDLILDQEGKIWFLEINPNGQWAWIENRTGLPISAAIVTELERIAA